jgi:hypothetical protein
MKIDYLTLRGNRFVTFTHHKRAIYYESLMVVLTGIFGKINSGLDPWIESCSVYEHNAKGVMCLWIKKYSDNQNKGGVNYMDPSLSTRLTVQAS